MTKHQAPEVTSEPTVDFVREWIMSGDYPVSQWERDFAAAIDARATQPQSLTIDDETVERLRELLGKATPGPWTYEDDDEGSSMGWVCAPNPRHPELSGESIFDVCGDSAQAAANAELAVVAKNALPGILDRLQSLSPVGDEAKLRAALKPFADLADEMERVATQHGAAPSEIMRRAPFDACLKARAALAAPKHGEVG